MINNPKDIEDILKEIDKITFDQLDKAIKETDKEFEQMLYNYQEEIFDNTQSTISAMKNNEYNTIESQQIEVTEIADIIDIQETIISEEEGENRTWMKEKVLVA